MKNAVWMLAVVAAAVAPPVVAQGYEEDVSVARVAYAAGDASYQRGDLEGWNELPVNTPLMTGDSIYAAPDGRIEVELGDGSVVRLDGGTQLDLLNGSDDVTQLGIGEGALDLRTRGSSSNEAIEVDTPSAAATILERGHYLVDVNDETATYSVIRGSLTVAVDGQQLDVYEGESLELSNTDPPTYAFTRTDSNTPFEDWCDRRASRYERSASVRYVNEQVVGCEDLDEHGSWRDVSEYGRVWVPASVGPGWAPYQSGRWIWQDPFGWTWVSYEPWGWAPYHYGRWAYVDNFWAWVPPPPPGYRGPAVVMTIQPRYAPALVAFVGGRNWGAQISVGGPAIGWVPLAPAERYYYPWQAPTRVVNNYRNITVVNAVTVVNYNTFATEPVRPIRVAPAQIRQAPVLGPAAIGVTPTRQSLTPTATPAAGAPAPRAARAERPLVARLVPPPKPKPFEQKVAEIERTGKPVVAPVAKPPSVGKPFTPEVQAPTGARVKSFSQPRGGEAWRELQARPGGEVRPPKPIERDIKPPPPRGRRTEAPASAQPAPELPGNRRPARPEAQAAPQMPERPEARETPPREARPPEARPPEVERPQPRPPEARRPDAPRPPEVQSPEARPAPGPPSDRTNPPRGNPKDQRDDQMPRSQAQPAPAPAPAPAPPPKATSDKPPSAGPMPKRTPPTPTEAAPQRPPSDQPQAAPKPEPRAAPKEPNAPKPPEAAPQRPPSDQPQTPPKPEPKGKKKPKPKEKATPADDKGNKPPEPPPENQN